MSPSSFSKYDNATAEDFWTVMTRSTKKPVDRIMQSFVERPGVPLVTVQTACEQDRTIVTLTQERFNAKRRRPRSSRGRSLSVWKREGTARRTAAS